ncbi:hypothetical protein [uncultured Clostridium sp.]|jgi:hypothetical protein|uniref:hypothetical protein n=1 Tax=uncultured Clostridium sp. TaxID=59620 RepID=UPI00272C21D0|nr:hypothetical protein [uncultured Clostridium sp.]
MEDVNLEEFLLKYDFRKTKEDNIFLTKVIRICLDTLGENDWIYFGIYYFDSEEKIRKRLRLILNEKVLKQNISHYYYDEEKEIFSIYLEDRN